MFLKLFAIALPVFLAIDLLWLGVIARQFYRSQIGHLLKPEVNWVAASVFYVLFLCGLIVFVIGPALQKNSLLHALLFGALFGLVTYATYDLTNLAVAKDWPLLVTIVDLLWGAVLSATVAVVTVALARLFV
jgi:uncharacterized membrane protein